MFTACSSRRLYGLAAKDRIEKMKWTNEIWHKFQNLLPFSAFLWQFLWKSRDISSSSENIREILRKFHQFFTEKWPKFIDQNRNEMKFHFIPPKKFDDFYLEFWGFSGAKAKKSCRSRKILKNASFLAIVAVDTAENEPLKVWGVSFHYFNRLLSEDELNRLLGWCCFLCWLLWSAQWQFQRPFRGSNAVPPTEFEECAYSMTLTWERAR